MAVMQGALGLLLLPCSVPECMRLASPRLTWPHTGTAALLLAAARGLLCEMQRWQISSKSGLSGLERVIPIFLSHHGLLFFLDK